ncbi:LacI family DNA-binding transcriptional regulator [Labrys sp. La1]|uniref:LacI family DNA-binding transcriptional regulator n=1 Tax=Labrys sp. La1 TaxID=3404917 RepID=UPI003EBC1C5B
MPPAKERAKRIQRRALRDVSKIRIGDVARAAGVSTATVSRALTFPDRVQTETRERVLAAVRELGYTPNSAARQLRAGSSRSVLVVVGPRRNPPFFSEVLRGIDTALSQAGYAVLMGNLDSIDGKEKYLVDLVFGGHIDGALVLASTVPSHAGRTIADSGIPIVGICAETDVAGIPAVVVDDEICCQAQTRYLLDRGHRHLAYLAGPKGNYNERHRYAGFQAEIAAAGLGPDDFVRFEGNYDFASGVASGKAFLALERRPTGVVATSDEMAIAFMTTIRRGGLRVPQDVSIIGFDGIELGDFVEPTLTTIRQPRFDLGSTGAKLLLQLMQGNAASQQLTTLKGALDERESAGWVKT